MEVTERDRRPLEASAGWYEDGTEQDGSEMGHFGTEGEHFNDGEVYFVG